MQDKRKSNAFAVSVGIIAVLLTLLVSSLFLLPLFKAKGHLKEYRYRFEKISDNDVVTLSDPLYKSGVSSAGISFLLDEDTSDAVTDKISNLMSGAKYKGTEDDLTGSWDIEIALRGEDGVYKLYFTEESFYIAKNSAKYFFAASDISEYEDFYKQLEALIANH